MTSDTESRYLATAEARELAYGDSPIARYKTLDIYAKEYVAEVDQLEALATISAGTKVEHNGRFIPRASKQGDPIQIHLHDANNRAPELRKRLEANGHRSLTIAFGFNDPSLFLQQRFMVYSATALRAYGDASGMVEIVNELENGKVKSSRHVFHKAGTERFELIAKASKVATSLYFYLAEWSDEGPRVIFPDGIGFYRLRTTSRNSVRAIVAQLKTLARHTSGRLAGIPFELSLDHREVADPSGAKRMIPVWTIVPKGPAGRMLTSASFRPAITSGIEQGAQLMLPAPRAETIIDAERAILEGEFVEEAQAGPEAIDTPTDDELALISEGGECDRKYWSAAWYALAKGSELEGAEARAQFLFDHTDGEFDSLAAFLRAASTERAHRLIEAAKSRVRFGAMPPDCTPALSYDDIFGEPEQDDDAPAEAVEIAETDSQGGGEGFATLMDPEDIAGPTEAQDAMYALIRDGIQRAATAGELGEAEHDIGAADLQQLITLDQCLDLKDRVKLRAEFLERNAEVKPKGGRK